MKKYLALLLLSVSLLAGCYDKDKAAVERERQRAEQAERARKIAEDEKSMWQTVACVVGVGAVVLLVLGTAIGSSARKDAEKKSGEGNE